MVSQSHPNPSGLNKTKVQCELSVVERPYTKDGGTGGEAIPPQYLWAGGLVQLQNGAKN